MRLMITYGADDWYGCMYYACDSNNIECIRLLMHALVYEGTTPNANHSRVFDNGLIGACGAGNIILAKMMICYGACDWNEGIRSAYIRQNKHCYHTLGMMLIYGAYDYNCSMGMINLNRHAWSQPMAEFLARHLASK